MANNLVKRLLIRTILMNNHSKINLNHPILFRSLCTDLKDVYSNQNLMRCLNDLNGLSYHQSTDEEKAKFFEITKTGARRAAVLIPFCFNEYHQPSILFTLRSPNLALHKNEICFPGGRECEIQDSGDLCKTVIRETKEELGVSYESINILGALKPIPDKKSNSFVFPVLATIDLTKGDKQNIEFHNKNKDEVEEIIIRPLEELIKVENWSFTHWKTFVSTPIYRDEIFNDKQIPRVWGLTSYFLYNVLTSLVPKHFKLEYSSLERYET